MTNFIDKLKKANETTPCENCGHPVFGMESHCKKCKHPNPNYVEMEPMSNEELNAAIRKEKEDRNKYTPDKPYGKSGK